MALTQDEVDQVVAAMKEDQNGQSQSISLTVGDWLRFKLKSRVVVGAIAAALGLSGVGVYKATDASVSADWKQPVNALDTRMTTVEAALIRLDHRFISQSLRQNYQWLWEAERVNDMARAAQLRNEIELLHREMGEGK